MPLDNSMTSGVLPPSVMTVSWLTISANGIEMTFTVMQGLACSNAAMAAPTSFAVAASAEAQLAN
jgi:hypothetical protein